MKNIWIEGIPGSGKSTLLEKLSELGQYHCHREGEFSPIELAWCAYMTEDEYNVALTKFDEISNEIKNKTMREDDYFITTYTKIRTEQYDFYQYMEQYEIYGGRRSIKEFTEIVLRRYQSYHRTDGVFECSFFQNIIEELMLFGMDQDADILQFYKTLLGRIDSENFLMIRLIPEDIPSSIQKIRKERINEAGEEVWYQAMMGYLQDSTYGKINPFHGFEAMIEHFERRIRLEDKIVEELLGDKCLTLTSMQYDMDEVWDWIRKND